MNKDEKDFETRVAARLHQRERMRAWIHVAAHTDTDNADYMLAAFDKRFPAPTSQSATPPPPAAQAVEVAPLDTNERHDYAMLAQEVSTLCEKARLYDKLCSELGPLKKKAEFWDAVASGKIILDHYDGNGWRCWTFGGTATAYFKSAAEAVQAAIDVGALK